MQYTITILFLFIFLAPTKSQDYYNKIIDVREGQTDWCLEMENHSDSLYTRSVENDSQTGDSYTRISKLNLEGDVLNTVILDSLTTFRYALRNMEFVENTLLILGNNSAEKQIVIQYCSTDLEDLGRITYTLDVGGSGIYMNYLLQNENYFYAVGHIYFLDDEFPVKDSEGIIVRINRSTMEVDSTLTYTRGTTDFIFTRPQIDELGNLSVSYIEWTDNDGIGGKQYGIIKYDEDLNEIWAFDIPFHNATYDATAHHYEFDNGNIVFADQGRDTFLFTASIAPALHCTNTDGAQIWRRQEYVISNEILAGTTKYYSEGVINQEGNLVLASYYDDPYISINARLICVSPAGELLWERLYESPSSDWDNANGEISGLIELSNGDIVIYGYQLLNLPNFNHWIIKVNSFGCLEPGCELTAVDDVTKEERVISIVPNLVPRNSSIFIEAKNIEEIKELEITFYSMNGKLLKTENTSLNSQHRVNVDNLPVGSYLVVVSDKTNILHTEKIIIVE